jgi:hypothetical protein
VQLPHELLPIITKALGPVDRICHAPMSKRLVLVTNFADLTIPASKGSVQRPGVAAAKGSVSHAAAQEIWNKLICERLKGNRGSEHTLCARPLLSPKRIEEAGLLAAEAGQSQE